MILFLVTKRTAKKCGNLYYHNYNTFHLPAPICTSLLIFIHISSPPMPAAIFPKKNWKTIVDVDYTTPQQNKDLAEELGTLPPKIAGTRRHTTHHHNQTSTHLLTMLFIGCSRNKNVMAESAEDAKKTNPTIAITAGYVMRVFWAFR